MNFFKNKLLIPNLNFDRKNSIVDQSANRKKEAASPKTNRSLSSELSPGRSIWKVKEIGLRSNDNPIQIHGKLRCDCGICQSKLHDSKMLKFFSYLMKYLRF